MSIFKDRIKQYFLTPGSHSIMRQEFRARPQGSSLGP